MKFMFCSCRSESSLEFTRGFVLKDGMGVSEVGDRAKKFYLLRRKLISRVTGTSAMAKKLENVHEKNEAAVQTIVSACLATIKMKVDSIHYETAIGLLASQNVDVGTLKSFEVSA